MRKKKEAVDDLSAPSHSVDFGRDDVFSDISLTLIGDLNFERLSLWSSADFEDAYFKEISCLVKPALNYVRRGPGKFQANSIKIRLIWVFSGAA